MILWGRVKQIGLPYVEMLQTDWKNCCVEFRDGEVRNELFILERRGYGVYCAGAVNK